MRRIRPLYLPFVLGLIIIASSCMTLDGSTSQRKDNKCCGVIKCDMHRASQRRKHKGATTASKSYRKKEKRIKRGY
mgnify:CR=1 FL=1